MCEDDSRHCKVAHLGLSFCSPNYHHSLFANVVIWKHGDSNLGAVEFTKIGPTFCIERYIICMQPSTCGGLNSPLMWSLYLCLYQMSFQCELGGLPILLFSTFKILCTSMGRSSGPHFIYALSPYCIIYLFPISLKMSFNGELRIIIYHLKP